MQCYKGVAYHRMWLWPSFFITFKEVGLRVFFLLGLLSFQAAAQDVIKIATTGTNEPWNFERKGEVVGYDIDVVNEVCARQELKCEYQIRHWGNIMQSLRFKQSDLIAASVYVNRSRDRFFEYGTHYGRVRANLVVKKSGDLASRPRRT